MSCTRSNAIRVRKNALAGLKVFETRALHNGGMVLMLTLIAVGVAVEGIYYKFMLAFLDQRCERGVTGSDLETTRDVHSAGGAGRQHIKGFG